MSLAIHPRGALHFIFLQYVGDGVFITVFLLCRHLNPLASLLFCGRIAYYHQT